MRAAVVGHVEWVEFARVDRIPASGEIAHASDPFDEPAGGGAVAAVQLARLAGRATLFTALGDDGLGERSRVRLDELGVEVHAGVREAPTRRALTLVEEGGERTITTIGARLAPRGGDSLPWDRLEGADGVYFTAGDADALRAARGARVLVATPRAGTVLREAAVPLDALVFSDRDVSERAAADRLEPAPALVVATQGADGGRFETADGERGRWEAERPPGPTLDTYGSGDSFAAALTWALAKRKSPHEAVRVAARAGAICMSGRGPYERQLGA